MASTTMPGATGGALTPTQGEAALLPLNGTVNAVAGVTATKLAAPAGAQFLVMKASVAGFNVRVGDQTSGMPSAEYPTVSVTDGSAGWHIDTGEALRLPAQTVTVKGYTSTSVLAYYWL